MLETMLIKKKTALECYMIHQEIDLTKLNKDLRDERLSQLANLQMNRQHSCSFDRLKRGSRLSRQVTACPAAYHPKKAEKDAAKMEKIRKKEEKANPFFKALKVQKAERDEHLKQEILQSKVDAMSNLALLPHPHSDMNLNSHREEDTTEYELVEETTEQELFVHTHVDID